MKIIFIYIHLYSHTISPILVASSMMMMMVPADLVALDSMIAPSRACQWTLSTLYSLLLRPHDDDDHHPMSRTQDNNWQEILTEFRMRESRLAFCQNFQEFDPTLHLIQAHVRRLQAYVHRIMHQNLILAQLRLV